MSGNIWEWTSEYTAGNRILRGGYWEHSESYCRVANRWQGAPFSRQHVIGFRLVRELN
ncbi:MAG: SUMF1/EgtB/PvdO family nonheme iron enzyme, partial [Planctomycetes bacterium]|nr:SUMF1/EgtB/PvdO family nonheme iron enzyme [Planctomycetota bacterium]